MECDSTGVELGGVVSLLLVLSLLSVRIDRLGGDEKDGMMDVVDDEEEEAEEAEDEVAVLLTGVYALEEVVRVGVVDGTDPVGAA